MSEVSTKTDGGDLYEEVMNYAGVDSSTMDEPPANEEQQDTEQQVKDLRLERVFEFAKTCWEEERNLCIVLLCLIGIAVIIIWVCSIHSGTANDSINSIFSNLNELGDVVHI